ncbi:sugar ABC transporter ATP-binding protein [Nakamurella alba]|nr:sugar ABC transporter ATP-binding protein [Nakamurella alba]
MTESAASDMANVPRHGAEPGAESVPRLHIAGMTKSFGSFTAVDSVGLDLRAGEIRALLGHNGSGKSTLIKCLSGFHRADNSVVRWNGEDVELEALRGSSASGSRLAFVHQTLGIVRELDAIDNLALHAGYRRRPGRRVDWRAQRRRTAEALEPFGFRFPLNRPLAEASPVERAIVAIAAVLTGWDATDGVLVLDEPTSVLPPHEVSVLLGVVTELRSRGASILYVSHRLGEVLEIADTATVLRNGRVVADVPVPGLTERDLVGMMLGRELANEEAVRAHHRPPGDELLAVRDLRGRYLDGAELTVSTGEITAVAGLVDGGRVELATALGSPARSARLTGEIRAGGTTTWRPLRRHRPATVGYVPADRLTEGIVAEMSVTENLTLSLLQRFSRLGLLSRRAERAFAARRLAELDVRGADDPRIPIAALSGGNQQKVIIGRALAADPQLLVMLEPTAGVDLAAKFAIYQYLQREAEKGLAVLLSTTDAEDMTALCDRVLVVGGGAVVDEFGTQDITQERVLLAMEGIHS